MQILCRQISLKSDFRSKSFFEVLNRQGSFFPAEKLFPKFQLRAREKFRINNS